MKRLTNILVATDLGAAGDQAIEAGREWARRHGARLAVVHVLPERGGHDEANTALAKLLPDADIRVVEGHAADRILDVAIETSADLIVLGGREASGARWVFGSVAEKIVARAQVPVLVARPERPGAILAATDFSEPSLPAVRAAQDVARRSGAPVIIMHCIERASGVDAISMLGNPLGADRDAVEAARERLREICNASPDDDSGKVVVGDPAASILRLSEDLPASLVVVASQGRTGLSRLLVGSVAAKVAREAQCSVLVVRLRNEAQ